MTYAVSSILSLLFSLSVSGNAFSQSVVDNTTSFSVTLVRAGSVTSVLDQRVLQSEDGMKWTVRKIGSSDIPSEVKFSLSIKHSSSVENWEAPLDERGSPTVCMLDTKLAESLLHAGKTRLSQ